jgi:TPR repeat protein
MASKPTLIDLESRTTSASGSYRLGLLSPRIQHFDGDVPPALSPLDAIAAHSRRLAKELEETRKAGERRMSRLPPHVVTASINEHQANRPQIFRSLSDQLENGKTFDREESGNSPEIAQPKARPMSSYPRISGVPEATQSEEDDFHTPREKPLSEIPLPDVAKDYFGLARTASPETLPEPESTIRTVGTEGVTRQQSTTSQPDLTITLVPPSTALTKRMNQLKLHHDSSDDDFASSNAGSTFSQHRKLSSNSGMSMPLSPVSPHAVHHPRSPSVYSATSEKEQPRSRSNLNFSRPMSSTSSTNLTTDSPSRQQSNRSLGEPSTSFKRSFDLPRTPTSFDETRSEASEGHVSGPSSSYTYEKFSLPRGRKVLRDSAIFSGLSTPHFEWAEPMFPSTPPLGPMSEKGLDTPSPPPTRAMKSFDTDARPRNGGFSFEFEGERNMTRDGPSRSPAAGKEFSPSSSMKSTTSSATRPSIESASLGAPLMPTMPLSAMDINSISSRSESTIRPQTARTNSSYQGLSADEHVTKAIELHEDGDLKESTYHLRIAAKQGHPNGMLLYALACRHGWGMRSNQKEGVQWLRKAVDCAMLEVADDEDASSDTPAKDVSEKKAHRAQFALSIYELGVSHLNGWGIEQDKALALRCFEIAGNWGDLDALTEAGFCYTQGIGCKKDLKKAAKLYRTAGAKGASMVGNSWIYKEKYDEKEEPDRKSRSRGNDSKTEKKTRDKSKTRSIFARKKFSQP